jgi:hypothetical protein
MLQMSLQGTTGEFGMVSYWEEDIQEGQGPPSQVKLVVGI